MLCIAGRDQKESDRIRTDFSLGVVNVSEDWKSERPCSVHRVVRKISVRFCVVLGRK